MAAEVSSRFSMRQLRSSLATDTMDAANRSTRVSNQGTKSAASFTSYKAAPKQRLNILDVQLDAVKPRDWADTRARTKTGTENNQMRKRRRWQEIQRWRKQEAGEGERKEKVFSSWSFLPDLILEHIFKFLTYRERRHCSFVCFPWLCVFWRRAVWARLAIRGDTMCAYQWNIVNGEFQAVVDTMRVSKALHAIGEKLRCLAFLPSENLHNIVTFQTVITRWCFVNKKKLPNIKCFTYIFPCDFARKNNEVAIYGTGGMILQNMKDLLECLPGLERLELVDLQLVGADAEHALDEVADVCRLSLQTLKIVNISRLPFSMVTVSAFLHLRCLIISPHNLGDDLVESLPSLQRLRHLHIVSNAYSEPVPTPVDYRVWRQLRKQAPRLRVHLVTEGKHKKEITFQTRAPVKSIVYDTPYTRVTDYSIETVVDLYKTDLEVYCHRGLPRFPRPRGFLHRPDSAYLSLATECPYLHTLMIREPVSSSTVLLLAFTAKNLRYFYVRSNAVILKCDWKQKEEWSDEFYSWLRRSSRSYADMEREVSQVLGFRWYALNDKQFKLTSVNLNFQYYYEGFEETGKC